MKNYEKPVVMVNEELAEGVYATGSGNGASSATCWTVSADSVQDWDGSNHVFEVRSTHSSAVEHTSTAITVTLTFSAPVIEAKSEFPCSYSGNTVTVTRASHSNGYKSGDSVTYKVWVRAADEATTKALSCTGKTISCTKSVNVQGGGADGN